MPKKIIDILPPKKSTLIVPGKSFEKKKKPSFSFSKKLIGFFVVLGVVLGSIIFLSFQSKLTLYVTPATEPVEFSQEVEINISQETVDFQKKIIPGKFFTETKEKWETFQATGKDFEESKARGTIKVYNTNNPPTAVTLRANTRFLSAEGGKIFRALEKIYLPAASLKGGKIVPSTREIEVIAQEGGEDYNIGPSKFSVPGLVGSALYYSVWAESENKMEGGFKKEIKKVAEEDLERAEESLGESLKELTRDSLKNKIPADFVLKDEGVFEEDFQLSCFAEPEELIEEFNCRGEIKLKGLAFQADNLEEFAITSIFQEIPPTKEIYQPSLTLDTLSKGLIAEGEKMILEIKIEGDVYERIAEDVFLSQIKGKSKTQIENIISKNYPQIENWEIVFWPFWIKKAPKNLQRINFLLTF